MISQTPFPGRLSANTRLIVRYHDSIPITHPHTIHDVVKHQGGHYLSLRRNRRKAFFVCNSEPTREGLVRLFPSLENRSMIIPCIISSGFYKVDDPDAPGSVIRTRLVYETLGATIFREKLMAERRLSAHFNGEYILSVGTLEPRKNYLTLILGWEQYRRRTRRDLKLVLVAKRGWKIANVLNAMRPHQQKGDLFHLEDVPLGELRILYSHAKASVFPSYVEGFDMGGIEAMLCACPVIASDIASHRWAYGDSAVYFDPYNARALREALVLTCIIERYVTARLVVRPRGVSGAWRWPHIAGAPLPAENARQGDHVTLYYASEY
jgi:hypothetical protein